MIAHQNYTVNKHCTNIDSTQEMNHENRDRSPILLQMDVVDDNRLQSHEISIRRHVNFEIKFTHYTSVHAVLKKKGVGGRPQQT